MYSIGTTTRMPPHSEKLQSTRGLTASLTRALVRSVLYACFLCVVTVAVAVSYCSLFQTPHCTLAVSYVRNGMFALSQHKLTAHRHVSKPKLEPALAPHLRPVPSAPFGPSHTCGVDSCSLSSKPAFEPAHTHRTQAVVGSKVDSEVEQLWYKKEAELWVEVHSEEQFEKEIESGPQPYVLVDFFATWCQGCQRSYPELCRVAKDKELQGSFKFVKVCVDELKKLSKQEGVKALPSVAVYKTGVGKLVNIDVPPSKVKYLKPNLVVISKNPGSDFRVDPNGFVAPVPGSSGTSPALKRQESIQRKKEIEALSQTGGLFEHLMSVARGYESPYKAAAPEQQALPAKETVPVKEALPSCIATDSHEAQLEKAMFLQRSGGDYGYKGLIDELYPREVGCRLKPGEHYMDYTGSSVYCQSQLDAVFGELKTCMFGNPHSANPSSSYTSERVEEVRDMVLKYFNADPAEYQVVFTRSATASLKTVGETFPWSERSLFRYLRENHNSVLGIREYALANKAAFQAVDENFVNSWCDTCEEETDKSTDEVVYNLFAFPGEDNFAGVKYPLKKWISAVKAKSTATNKWLVALDAAAYVPTQPLDLATVHPDFVVMSFYKMFGYPTGLGALIVRVDSAAVLKKVFWGGGTVALATSKDNFHVLKCKPTDKFEDGTVNFLDVISLKHGFDMFQRLGGIRSIQAHVASLTEYLYNKLIALRHPNGSPVVTIYGKHSLPNWKEVQGGIINFEVLKPDGTVFSYKQFEREAAAAGFHVRTGAECNPGACYAYLGVEEAEIETLAGLKEGCEDDVEFIHVQRPVAAQQIVNSSGVLEKLAKSNLVVGHPAEVAMKWVDVPLGSVRVSLGYMSTFEDCYSLVEFVKKNYVNRDWSAAA